MAKYRDRDFAVLFRDFPKTTMSQVTSRSALKKGPGEEVARGSAQANVLQKEQRVKER